MKTLNLLCLAALVLWAGCASFETNAYRTLGTTATLVDAAMQAWGGWVREGQATPTDEKRVREAYQSYQSAMRSARVVMESHMMEPNPRAAEHVLTVVAASAGPVIELIRGLLPGERAAKVRTL